VLCVSDVSLLPLLLVKLGFKKVYRNKLANLSDVLYIYQIFILESVSPMSTQVMNEVSTSNL